MDEPPKALEHREEEHGEPLTPGQSRAFAAAHDAARIAALHAVPDPIDALATCTFAELRELVESAAFEAAFEVACLDLDEGTPLWFGAGK